MKNSTRLFALPFLALAAFALPAAAQDAPQRMDGPVIVLRAGPNPPAPTFVASDEDLGVDLPANANFNVTYNGFSPEAKKAFQRAVDIWARLLDSNVTITVQANFVPLGQGILGSAGPSSVWRDFSGAKPGFWYVDALANKLRGQQMDPSPDIVANFSSVFPNWHFGKGNAPGNEYDFTTVVLHELGHGLGFLGGASMSGGGSVEISNFPVIYSKFVENKNGKKILTFPDPSSQLGSQLTGGKLFLDSKKIRNKNNNKPAKIFAPNPFQQGSSYSHLDEATFPAGNPNSLMTPQLGQGETIRDPGDITLALFKDLGW